MQITDALKKNSHDLNEQAITSHQRQYCCLDNESLLTLKVIFFPANGFHKIRWITDALEKNAHDLNKQTITSPQHQYRCLHQNHH